MWQERWLAIYGEKTWFFWLALTFFPVGKKGDKGYYPTNFRFQKKFLSIENPTKVKPKGISNNKSKY